MLSALPQPTLHATLTIFVAARTTPAGRTSLALPLKFNSPLTRLILKQVHRPLVRPVGKSVVPVATPIPFINPTGVANHKRPNSMLDTPFYRRSRPSVSGLDPEAVHLYDLSCGFQPQREVVDCKL